MTGTTRGLVTGKPVRVENHSGRCADHWEMILQPTHGELMTLTGKPDTLLRTAIAVVVIGDSVAVKYEKAFPTPCNGCLSRNVVTLELLRRDGPQAERMDSI